MITNNITKINVTLLIFISFLSAYNPNKNTSKGVLFFKLVNISSPSGMSSEEISKIENRLKNVEENDNELIAYYKTLKKKQCYRKSLFTT